MQLARNVEPGQIALAVPHDLVRPVALIARMSVLPITGIDALGLRLHGAGKSKICLEYFPIGADRPALGIHQVAMRRARRTEAAIVIRILRRERADRARVKFAFPILPYDGLERVCAPPRR